MTINILGIIKPFPTYIVYCVSHLYPNKQSFILTNMRTHLFSLRAPMHPMNDMKKTTAPEMMRSQDATVASTVPNVAPMKLLSTRKYIPRPRMAHASS